MPIIKIDGKPTFVDFVEYADVEYEKWLKERDEERKKRNVQSKSNELTDFTLRNI